MQGVQEKNMKTIYLDNAATTPVDERVFNKMKSFFSGKYGNASSLHHKGQEAKMALDEAREVIAKSIGSRFDEIVFTGSGTEANNLALKGLALERSGGHIITSKIEHDCVLNTCKFLEKKGFSVSYLDVDSEGFVDLEQLEREIRSDTIIVSVIHGNNEIGVIQDLEKIYDICKKKNVVFHTDACQSFTKTKLNVKMADMITLNAHKIHGPKGVGALYVSKRVNLKPLLHGGGHEFGLRSSTENVAGIVGFAEAVKIADGVKHMYKLRDRLVDGILKIKDTRLNGPNGDKRLCNNINVSFKYIEGESVGAYLDVKGICSSTGSACSSTKLEASHVLKAIGLSDLEAHGSLRLSLSRFNSVGEVDKVLEVLPGIVEKLRRISPFGGEK